MDAETYESARRVVAVPHAEVSHVDVGAGAPALFVHGLMLNNAAWRPLIAELQGLRRCLAPDLLGHGRTRIAAAGDVSLHAQAEMLNDFCEALRLEPVDLVANDFGGAVAQIFATRYPDRVRTMSLTNCDTHYNLGPPADLRRIVPPAEAGVLGETVASMPSHPELARAGFPGRGFANPELLTEDLIDELITPGFSYPEGRRHFERFVLSIRGDELAELEADLRTLRIPTVLVWGTDDVYFGVAWAYWLRDVLPECREVVELDGGRLFIQLERTKEVAEAIRNHWSADRQATSI